MKQSLLLIASLLFLGACSSSRWVVTDQNSINMDQDPVILGEEDILLLQEQPTVDDPVMRFATYRIVEKQYEERVLVERTIQKYRPQWKFLALGMSGAVFAALAANTNIILPSISIGQKLAFNLTAGILAALSFSNMEPRGDPIYTGETKLQRRSGHVVVRDTLVSDSFENDLMINLSISYRDEEVFSESDIPLNSGTFDINLASFAENLGEDIDGDSSIQMILSYNGTDSSYTVPVTDFLAPFVTVTTPVAILRNSPAVSENNVVTEVGTGSSFEWIEEGPSGWNKVQFGGSEVYLSNSVGTIEWRAVSESGTQDVFEFANVPFGEIDVENSVPVLKENNPNDRAIILTNGFSSSAESRQYLERDHDLFRFYMRYGLQMASGQIQQIEIDSTGDWQNYLTQLSEMDSTGTLIVYLTGFATINSSGSIYLQDPISESETSHLQTTILEAFERIQPSSVVLFADLDYQFNDQPDQENGSRSDQTNALQEFANELLRRVPNSAIVFSNRPGQTSSLYIGRQENRRHHIFSYFIADALKKRNTTLAEIIRHLENNVDYTSRRLHDRPQDIQAFGNFTIDLAD